MNRRVIVAGAVLAGMTMMVITLAGVFVAASAVAAVIDDAPNDILETAREVLADTAVAQADERRGNLDEGYGSETAGDDYDGRDPEEVERVVRKGLMLSGEAKRLLGEPFDITIVASGDAVEFPMHMADGHFDWTPGAACGALDGIEDEVGVLVAGVVPGSAADEAGLARGDIVLAVDGQAVDDTIGLHEALAEIAPGDTVTLEVLHGDDARTLSAEMGECEGEPFLGMRLGGLPMSMSVVAGSMPHMDMLELHGDGVPHDLLDGLLDGLEGDLQGLVVLDVVDDSAAEAAGVEPGDVIVGIDGVEVASPDTLVDAVGAREVGDTMSLTVVRSDEAGELELQLTLGERSGDPGQAFAGIVAAYIEAHIDDSEGERRVHIEAMPGKPAMRLHGTLGAPDSIERGLEKAKEIVGAGE